MSAEELVKELRRSDGWDHIPSNVLDQVADKLEELAAENERLSDRVETLESFRPHWAKGYSSDSMAAQSATAALSDIWKFLGVSNQTEAMSSLAEAKREIAALREALEQARIAMDGYGWKLDCVEKALARNAGGKNAE